MVFIKGDAFVAEEKSLTELSTLKKGQTLALGITPANGSETIVVTVHISAVDASKHSVRIEGYTYHNNKRGNVITLLTPYARPDGKQGYAEITFYS